MSNQHISWLESRLEELVEGTFTNLFSRRISTHEIALQIARSLEDNRRNAEGSDPRPIAPDIYMIYMDAELKQRFMSLQPDLPDLLAVHLVELAKQLGYRLLHTPQVTITALNHNSESRFVVESHHQDSKNDSTAIMQPIKAPKLMNKPVNAQLMIDNERTIALTKDVINIGRSHNNEIILDDTSVSRHHLQIRLRFGSYTVFDIPGKNTTYVNDVPINHHKLQSGDVIRIGSTQLVYYEDAADSTSEQGNTDVLNPV